MIKFLIVGDLHTKLRPLMELSKIFPKYDRIIFLGDYVDDWDAPPQASEALLKQLIQFKIDDPERITLLAGNHCLSSCFADKFKCSGYNQLTHELVKDLYRTKIDGLPIFQIALAHDNFLFTHAGVTQSFWKDTKLLLKNHYPEYLRLLDEENPLALQISQTLNTALLLGWENPQERLFLTLSQAGPTRGGLKTPSPIWTDKDELLADPIPEISQVVGHTPVRTVHEISNLYFCDTFSESYYPYLGTTIPLGDRSVLELSFHKNHKIKSKIILPKDYLNA